jgi:hypothetical protein
MELLVGILVKALFFTFIVGMFTFVIRMFVRGHKEDARIREEWKELAQIASERGWTYTARVRGQLDQYCGVGPMPGRGENLSAWHYTTGEFRGRSFKCFEHRYNSPMSGGAAAERKRPIIESVFVVMAPGSGPSVEVLRPSKLDAALDRRPKMPLGVPEFDERFRVVADDETFVRNALSADVVSFLLAHPEAKKSPLQLRDNQLFTWYTGTLSPEAVDEKLKYLCDVLDRIPAQAWTTA